MSNILNFIVFLILFASIPVANSFNMPYLPNIAMNIVLLFGFSYFILYKSKINFTEIKFEVIILLLAFTIIIIKLIFGQIDQIKHVAYFIFVPIMLSIQLSTLNIKQLRKIRFIIYLFYVLECILAIYEKLTLTNTFSFINEEEAEMFILSYDDIFFRSSSLLGHPLINAVVVSILLSYFLISEINNKLKFTFLILGFLAILSFNARGAIIIWSFLGIYFLIKYFKKIGTKNIKFIILIISLSLFIIMLSTFLFDKGFGGRLITGQLIDGSALTRIDLISNFDYINIDDFFLGNTNNYKKIIQKREVSGIENSYIVVILNYGIIASITLFIFYFLWLKKSLILFSKWKFWFIIIGFILVGSLNNSLAGYTPWLFFVIVHKAFVPIIKSESSNYNEPLSI